MSEEQTITSTAKRGHGTAADGGGELLLDGIVKQWRGHSVLDGLDLEVEPGSCVLVAGRNGVGKTTLLRIAAGLIKPDAGVVLFDGLHPERNRQVYQQRVSLVSAGDRGLYARLNVRRHLDFWARVSLIPADRRQAVIDDILDRFALRELAPQRVDRISMGQRQRLRLAMAFLPVPDLVLLDEPRNSLDEEAAAMLMAAVREVLDRGGSAIWCVPSGENVDFPASRAVLEDGRLRRS